VPKDAILFGQGEQYLSSDLNLDAKYGEGCSEELQYKARQTVSKITRADYEGEISYYKKAVENLKKEKGLE
jgi:hypothetical protein